MNIKKLFRKRNESFSEGGADTLLPLSDTQGGARSHTSGADLVFQYEESGVISLGRRRFAAGLIWVPVNSEDSLRDRLETAEKIARSNMQTSSYYSLVSGSLKDDAIGFGSINLGHAKGMRSLVKSIDETVAGKNWLIVITIKDAEFWWIGSMRDGVVLIDRVFRDEDNARLAFDQAVSAPEWDMIISPEIWGVEASDHFLTDGFLKKTGSKLTYAEPVKFYGPRVAITMLFLGILSGGVAYYMSEQKKFEVEQAEIRKKIESAISLKPSDYPWFSRTSLSGFIEQCSSQIQDMVVLAAGWENQIFTCSAEGGTGSISTGWTRAGGVITWLRASLPDGYPPLRVAPNLESATVDHSFDVEMGQTGNLDTPWTRDVIESRLAERFQARSVIHSLRYVEDTRPPDVTALFHRHDIQVQGKMAPVEIVPLLQDIPALIPQTLTYNLATAEWNFIFRLHHPVIIPEVKTP